MLLPRFSSSIMGLKQMFGPPVSYFIYCSVVYHRFGQVYFTANTLLIFCPASAALLKVFSFWSSKTQQGIFDAVLKGHIDFDSDPWPLISDSGKDLIRKMLCSQPSDRLTAHQVLCHPWICENGVAPDRSLDPAVLSRLKQFSAMNKLKKMALRVNKAN
ncbi:calcium-dependent protein kinase 4-like [Cicer arietinum]|uniref:calcium-dependent protein kinase 4-like n=1 Tax=Cicer arietinum TaxID=3827 RepID=UPI003CC60C60